MRVQAAVLSLVALSLLGCQKAQEKVMEEVAEQAIEQEVGGNAKVEASGGSLNIQADGVNVNIDAQGGVKLPENLPKDLFVPSDAKVTVANTTPEGAMITFEQAVGIEKATRQMKEEMQKNGWSQTADLNMNGQRMVTYTKGEQEAALMVAGDGSKTTTTMTVTFK